MRVLALVVLAVLIVLVGLGLGGLAPQDILRLLFH